MKLRTVAAGMLALLWMTGCNAQPGQPVSETTAGTPQATQSGTPAGDIPVLSIVSASGSDDFVTQPVDAFVANSIASWTWGYVMPPAPYYEDCTVTLTDADGTVCTEGEAQVKVRGNWTTSYTKKPLRIKFAEKQPMLGLNDGAECKNWVLLACYKDKSLLRDKTALQMSREILGADGLYAADASLVQVEVNGKDWGVYLLADYQQTNSHRIAITEPEKGYEGTDIGYLLEYDGYYEQEDPLERFTIDYADNAPLIPFDGKGGSGREVHPLNTGAGDRKENTGFTINSDIYSQAQHDFIADYMANVYRILYAAAYEDKAYIFNNTHTKIAETTDLTPQEAVEAAVDVQSLVDMYIISEVACDADLYWSSFFMDVDFGKDGDGKLRFEAPWDFDSALGNKDRIPDGEGFYAGNIIPDVGDSYEACNPWLCVLMNEDWYQDLIRKTWTRSYDAGVFEHAKTMIAEDTARYADAFAKNDARWGTLQHNEAQNEMTRRSAQCTTPQAASDYLSEWLESRVAFLNAQWHE